PRSACTGASASRSAGIQLVFWGIVLLHQLFWLDSLLGGRLSAALLQWIG
ncbi:hypothetical protein ACLBVR_31205, partial [Pseudomonas aeruginosa]